MLRSTRSMLSNILLLMALVFGILAVAPAPSYAAQGLGQELMFKVTANGVEGPKQAMPGLTTFVVENATGEPGFGVFFVRVKEGKTIAEVQAAVGQGGPDAATELIDAYGGVFGFPPGMSQRFTQTLRPGAYLLAGDPSKGQLAPLEVMEGVATLPVPQTDVEVTLKDFEIVMPKSISEGTKSWMVTNVGAQEHELVYFQLAPGKTLDDLLSEPEDENAPPPFDIATLGGAPGMVAGVMQWSPAAPKPGRYVAVCFIEDPATQKPHAALGMVTEFTVGTAAGPGNLPATGEAPVPVALPDTGARGVPLLLLAAALGLFSLGVVLRRRSV